MQSQTMMTCEGTTKNGEQCLRKMKDGQYCWQHCENEDKSRNKKQPGQEQHKGDETDEDEETGEETDDEHSTSKTIVENALGVPSLSMLVKLLSSPGYEKILKTLKSPGKFTVFAPSNEAFSAAKLNAKDVDLVTQVLLYHVLPTVVKSTDLQSLNFPSTLMSDKRFVSLGGKSQVLAVTKDKNGVSINFGIPGVAQVTARVIKADVGCSNGVVHIIDRVLMFPELTSVTAKNAGLTELIAALRKAKMVDAVNNSQSITIFAPTNAALKAAKWRKLDIATLQAVLKHHVVPTVAFSTDLKNMQKFKTLQDASITVRINGKNVQINDANVAVANVLIRNGVVHVIDKVLIPPQK